MNIDQALSLAWVLVCMENGANPTSCLPRSGLKQNIRLR